MAEIGRFAPSERPASGDRIHSPDCLFAYTLSKPDELPARRRTFHRLLEVAEFAGRVFAASAECIYCRNNHISAVAGLDVPETVPDS
jgi:hypothetical protein